eukprot:m51a1_g12566 hypothetical protein (621) ;mRNA; f:23-2907
MIKAICLPAPFHLSRTVATERTLQALVDASPEFGKDVEMRLVEIMEDPHVAGWSITTHQQTIDGIPIVGAILKAPQAVWNGEGEVVSVTGTTVADAHERTHLRARTAVSQQEAVGVAQRAAEARDSEARCVEAGRVVLRPGMANGEPGPNLPAWEVVCGTADVYVSTQSPSVLALNPRKSHLVSKVYDEPTGGILWQSGQPFPADPDVRMIVDGVAIAERVWKSFSGHDCYDNKGSTITAFMHLNMSNAYYYNRSMSFGLDYISEGVLWHDGSLNEAWSDILAGVIDIMQYQHALRPEDECPTDDSLIPSHAFAVLTDGSVKHGITGIGLNASMKIFTRAKFLSTPMTTFSQYAAYLATACEQLKLADNSITASTCNSVAAVITATQLSDAIPNPIWVFQVKCPVPPSLNAEENVTVSLVIVPDVGLDIYSTDFIPQSAQLKCDPDIGVVTCLNVYLCPKATSDPSSDNCAILDVVSFVESVRGVLRAEVKMEDYQRGKYFVYVSQHGRRPVSNAAVITVKNALATLQICTDIADVHVVVTEAVFGSVDADTDGSGCVTFELEKEVVYNIVASKDHFLEERWTQKIDNATVTVHETLIASAGLRKTVMAWPWIFFIIVLT